MGIIRWKPDSQRGEERQGREGERKKYKQRGADENTEDKVTMTSDWQDGVK